MSGKNAQPMPTGLPIIHERAAGIDIGSRFHVAAVSPDLSDEPVRTFQAFTSYDPVRDRWTEESPNPSPPGRWGHAMSYDSARRELLLFGGIPSNQGTVLN